jgi:DNA-binding GntR family transcriptional regulator
MRSTLALGERKEVVRIKRTRYVDDQPYAFTINVLPLESEAILLGTAFSKHPSFHP